MYTFIKRQQDYFTKYAAAQTSTADVTKQSSVLNNKSKPKTHNSLQKKAFFQLTPATSANVTNGEGNSSGNGISRKPKGSSLLIGLKQK